MWFCCNVARALLELGRDAEAEEWLDRGRETAASVEALPCAAQCGELEAGERLARETVALADETDMPNAQAGALTDLAWVLVLLGHDVRAEFD